MVDNQTLIQALLMGGYPEGTKIPGPQPPFIPDEQNFVSDPTLPQGTIFHDPLNSYDPMDQLKFYRDQQKHYGFGI